MDEDIRASSHFQCMEEIDEWQGRVQYYTYFEMFIKLLPLVFKK